MAGFNCNLRKKRTFELTLPDEKETVVLIKSPSKDTVTALFEIFPKFSNLGKNPNAKTMAGVSEDAYDLGVDIINNNQSGYVIDKEKLKEYMDFFMLIEFVTEFTQFITESISEKN